MIITVLFLAVCFVAFTNGANANFKGVASLYGSGTTTLRQAALGERRRHSQALSPRCFSRRACSLHLAAAASAGFAGRVAGIRLFRCPGRSVDEFPGDSLRLSRLHHACSGRRSSRGGIGWRRRRALRGIGQELPLSALLQSVRRGGGWGNRLSDPQSRSPRADHPRRFWTFSISRAPALRVSHVASTTRRRWPRSSWPCRVGNSLGISSRRSDDGDGRAARHRPGRGNARQENHRDDPGQGFAASLVTAGLVTTASLHSLPVSTTHVSVGSLMGMGPAPGRLTGQGRGNPVRLGEHRSLRRYARGNGVRVNHLMPSKCRSKSRKRPLSTDLPAN